MMFRAFLVAALLAAAAAHVLKDSVRDSVRDEDADRYRVPADILWGAGVSALQTEGAWDEDGKAESAADHVILSGKVPGMYTENHKVAADSYHHYKEDVAAAAALKLKMYKFSMSWARVLPTADASKPNPLGVQFYNNLINEIIKQGMTPVVTMYHFDHPQLLEDEFKGWLDRKMVDKFAEYSKFVFDTFGDRVPFFVTINEPNMYCSYFTTQMVAAGFLPEGDVNPYECIHNNILSHQAAYKIYQEGKTAGKYPANGKVGYSALLMHSQPATGAPEDVYAAEVFNQLHAGTSFGPVVHGDYPQVIKSLLGDKLPKFTDTEKAALADSTDFLGINIYFGMITSYNRFMNSTSSGVTGMVLGEMSQDIPFIDANMDSPAGGGPLAAFTTINPSVMKDALLWVWTAYKKPVFITENGYGDMLNLGTHDTQRAAYHSAFLRSLVTTVKDYGVGVVAYSAWSLIDGFEFSGGYNRPFGLVHVDFKGKTLARTIKDSSSFWIKLGETGVVPYVENPDDATTTSAPTTSAPTTSAPTTSAPATTTARNSATSATGIPFALLASFLAARAVQGRRI